MIDEHVCCIVGSRDWSDLSLVRDFIDSLPMESIVVSGGARGVDTHAEFYARKTGRTVLVFPARWDSEEDAGPKRNERMARFVASVGGMVLAFHKDDSPGTRNMLNWCRSLGIPYTVEHE